MHAFADRRTDGQTDRRTEISSQDRVCIPYSAVKMNAFSNETCLNVKHQPFIFQRRQLNDTRRSDRMRDATAAIAGSVVETTYRPPSRSFFINDTFSSTSKLLTPNMYCWSCKTRPLSPYTGRISEWMVLGQRLFAQRKWITERCSLRDAFSGSVAIFIVDKWRHSDVIVIKRTAVIQN